MTINAADSEKLIKKYKNLAIQHMEGSKDGDSRKANKAYAKLRQIYDKFRQDDALAEGILTTCLRSDNAGVRIWAAAHLLGLKKHIGEAEKVLAEISQMDNIGVIRSTAEMTLKVWKRQEYL